MQAYNHVPSRHARRRKRRTGRIILIALALAVVAGGAWAAVRLVLPRGAGTPLTGFVPTGSSPGQDAEQITTAFVQAWTSGNLAQAARYTDHPASAQSALTGYRTYLHLRGMTATVDSASTTAGATPREKVGYTISATVASTDGAKALRGTWKYRASLVAYQKKNSSLWYIAWAPDVLAPNLTAATHLAAVAVAPEGLSVGDASGNALTSYHDAGLTGISNLLASGPPPGYGRQGLDVEIQTAKGKLVANSQAVIIAPGNISSLNTTISPQAEAAARNATGMHPGSAMVAIQPSTGKILAIANNAGFNDFALTAAVAPGSTGKIISSTALFTEGVLNANSPDQCPLTYTVQGVTFHNDQGESEPSSATVTTDFAQSCNNAFDRWWSYASNGRLAAVAKKYYGLDEPWNVGIGNLSATYYNTPASASGSELAQEMFGEGQITASPLGMASVAATVDAGTFRQPYLVNGTKQVTATPLPAGVDAGLKQMMRAVITSGTGAGLGFGPDVYGKTGTADIVGQQQPNSWFVAFDPVKDVAVACLVVNIGYGAQYAGPEVSAFLNGY
jgi:hypothetical protein